MKNRIGPFLRSQNFRNSAWNLLNTVTYPFLVIMATPFFISRLGTGQYGIWMLINTTTQLMSVFNLGLGDTAIKYISNHKALGEDDRIRETTAAISAVGLCVFILAIGIGIGLFDLIGAANPFSIEPGLLDLAAKSALLAFLLFGLKFLEQIILSIFQGYERYDFASVLSLASRVVILAANVLLVYYGFTLLEVFASSSALLVFFLIMEGIIAKKKFHAIRFTPSFRRGPLRSIFSFGLWSWFQSLLAIVTTQTDKLIVAGFSGVQMLTYYSLGSLLTTQIHGVFTSVCAWVFPAVSKKAAQGVSLDEFYRRSDLYLMAFGFASIAGFLFVEHPLLTFWLGAETYERSIPFIRVFLYYNLFLLLNILPYYFLNGSGHVRQNTLAELITKLLNVAGMVIGYLMLGTVGLAWGLVASMLVATPIRITFVKRLVLHTTNMLYGTEVLLCPLLIIGFYESRSFALRTIFVFVFTVLFYRIYVFPRRHRRASYA